MSMNFRHFANLVAVIILYLIPLINVATLKADDENFSDEAMNLVMRKIGHDILLSVGDSSSRVLPIQRLDENEFQIRFESRFTFVPDTLITIVERLIIAHHLSRDYIVNVYDCSTNEVVFGYAMLENRQNNIVACTGRTQPVRCYYINIHFAKEAVATGLYTRYVLVGVGLLSVGFVFMGVKRWKHSRHQMQRHITENTASASLAVQRPFLSLGKALFYYENQYLVVGGETIELTAKESKLLHIFAENPNQIIERNRLQKEVWEDEGVIVGRSLDMFISKLRKKLSGDSSLKLSNIHGKGYKLETMLQEELH